MAFLARSREDVDALDQYVESELMPALSIWRGIPGFDIVLGSPPEPPATTTEPSSEAPADIKPSKTGD